jgi:hypothetical protein
MDRRVEGRGDVSFDQENRLAESWTIPRHATVPSESPRRIGSSPAGEGSRL